MTVWPNNKDNRKSLIPANSEIKLDSLVGPDTYDIRRLIKNEDKVGRGFKDEYGFGLRRVKSALKGTYGGLKNITLLDLRVIDIVYHSSSILTNVPYVRYCFLAREGDIKSGWIETAHINDMGLSELDLTPYRKYKVRKQKKQNSKGKGGNHKRH